MGEYTQCVYNWCCAKGRVQKKSLNKVKNKLGVNMNLENWCELPTKYGVFRMYDTEDESVTLISACEIDKLKSPVLLRMHSSCRASEIFHALDCDCADQLEESMKILADQKNGLVIYLHQEDRGQGLSNKIRAVRLMQKKGVDTVESFHELGLELDPRSYEKATRILKELNIKSVALITNNPRKIKYLRDSGINVSEIIQTNPQIRDENREYLISKKIKLAHQLQI